MQFFRAMGCHELGHNDQPEVLSSSCEKKIFKNYFCTVRLKISKKEYRSTGDKSREEAHTQTAITKKI